MRVAQRERGDLSLHVGAVTDTDDIQLPCETGADALNSVRGKRTRQAVQRGMIVARALDVQSVRGLLEADPRRDRHGELTLRASYFQLIADDHLDARRQRDRLFTNSRHSSSLLVASPYPAQDFAAQMLL